MAKNYISFLQKYIANINIFTIIEKFFLRESKSRIPPIFIIGIPRSGSTILYQLLVKYYNLSYFPNISNFFFKSPVTAAKILFGLKLNYKPKKLISTFGLVKGINGPSEAGSIFRYWFQKLQYNKTTIEYIRLSIYNMSSLRQKPFISKNLYNNYRIENLFKIFPDAIFIHIKRDPLYVAQSILLARKKNYKNYVGWFGLKPENFNTILNIEDPFQQVVEQINSINRSMRKELEKNKINYLELNYHDLCNNTESQLKKIENSYNNIISQKMMKKQSIVENIQSEDYQKLDNNDWKRLKELIIQDK